MPRRELGLSNQGWLHELARIELYPDAEKLFNLQNSFDPQQLVEESTIQFLGELREQFGEFAQVFNGYSEGNSRFQEVKVYSIAQSAADFLIYRNQIKLVISNTAHGVIQLAFASHVRGGMAVDGQVQGSTAAQDGVKAQELLAQVGPFRDVSWTFQGERVTAAAVAKFYFAEFVRASRDISRSRASNQILLEQIKTLLQERGIDL